MAAVITTVANPAERLSAIRQRVPPEMTTRNSLDTFVNVCVRGVGQLWVRGFGKVTGVRAIDDRELL